MDRNAVIFLFSIVKILSNHIFSWASKVTLDIYCYSPSTHSNSHIHVPTWIYIFPKVCTKRKGEYNELTWAINLAMGFQFTSPALLCYLQTVLYAGEEGWFEGRKYEEGEINVSKS